MIKWSKSNESHPGTIQLLGKQKSQHSPFQTSVGNRGLHRLRFHWKINFLYLTDMRMSLQQLTIPWGNHLSHTHVWPPPAPYEQPSSLHLCLHAGWWERSCPLHAAIGALAEGSCRERQRQSSSPAAARLLASRGFFLFFFSPTPGFSAYWAEAIFLSSVTPLTAETSEHTGQIKKKT